jgi:hypothetical protein
MATNVVVFKCKALPDVWCGWARIEGNQIHAKGQYHGQWWSAVRISGAREWTITRMIGEKPTDTQFNDSEKAAISKVAEAEWGYYAQQWGGIRNNGRGQP